MKGRAGASWSQRAHEAVESLNPYSFGLISRAKITSFSLALGSRLRQILFATGLACPVTGPTWGRGAGRRGRSRKDALVVQLTGETLIVVR